MRALTFLHSVAGYARGLIDQQQGSAARPLRFGVVDQAYTGPPALPRVTFEGEDTMSGKEYAWSGAPVAAGDRVALLPAGTTYMVIGAVGGTSAPLPAAQLRGAIVAGFVSITPVINSPTMGTWTYGRTLAGTVRIQVSANTGFPGSAVEEVSFAAPTATSCEVYIYRTGTTATTIHCLATGGLG